ncbi:MAG: hypothetical protein WCA46_11695 [Actinocatenispora sp.]
MSVSSLYVGRLADNPVRDYTLDGSPLARFLLCCPAAANPARPVGTEGPGGADDEVAIAVQAADTLAELVLRDLHRGDRLLVVGGLATSPPDATRRGATDLFVRASHIGLDVTTGGWRRDPVEAAPVSTAFHPEYHW